MSGAARGIRSAALLTLIAAALAGCQGIPVLKRVVAPKRIKAEFPIDNRPTLVLVDDPRVQLGNPALAGVIANRMVYELRESGAVSRVIPPSELAAYQLRYDRDFSNIPVDRVGRDLGAEQVVYLWIEQAGFERPSPLLFRPNATVRVKIVDAGTGRRLFPRNTLSGPAGGIAPASGHRISTQFEQRLREEPTAADLQIMARELAERIGREAAQLFFDHLPRQPGEPME